MSTSPTPETESDPFGTLLGSFGTSFGRRIGTTTSIGQQRLDAVYIGHLARDVSDELLKKILLQCGTVTKWTRSRDPLTDAPATFGFCEFDSPEAVWRLNKLVNNLSLGGHKIIVTCPQKTKDLVDRWHAQRLYHLQKANPSWTPQQVEAEFLADDERVRSILSKIVEDVEKVISSNKAEREADEAARKNRLAAMKSRLHDRKEAAANGQPAAKRIRSETTPRAAEVRATDDRGVEALPESILECEQRRLERWRSFVQSESRDYEILKRRWSDGELRRLSHDSQRRLSRFREALSRSRPSRRDILQMIEADLRGVNITLSLIYLETLAKSPFYEIDTARGGGDPHWDCRQLILEASRIQLDDDGIPVDRTWQKKVLRERKRLRDYEQRRDKQDLKDQEQEELFNQKLQALREAIRLRQQEIEQEKAQTTTEVVTQPPEQPEPPAARPPTVDEDHPLPPPEPASRVVEWLKLKENGFLAADGPLKTWLLQKTADLVGQEDASELADYVMDLLPPKASSQPTQESLRAELQDFLDEETHGFVEELFNRLVAGR